jgi:cytoskeletal protein CcmA (bactofilin family)
MFKKSNNNMARTPESDSTAYNLIDAGTTIIGDIKTEGNIRIDGTLEGSVTAKGKVVIGPSGKIEGEVFCQNADVSGTLKAKITVSELLSLQTTANILGDIITNKLKIEPGANFTGSCSMGAVIKEMNDDRTEEKKSKTA